jgi:integrase
VIPLVPYVVAALRARREEYLAERGSYTVDHDLVWCHPDGRPIGRRADYQEWRNILARSNIPHVELHGLRHTTASLLQEIGTPESVVQQIMGHSRVTTTRGYMHGDDEPLTRAALVALGQVLELEET